MPDESQLIAAAARTAAEADSISATFARQLSSVLRDAERRIADLLVRSQPPSRSVQVQAAQAMRVRGQIRANLIAAGYDALVDHATGAALDRMAERVLQGRRIAKVSAELGPEVRPLIEAMRTLHFQDLLEERDVVVRAITQAVTRGMFGAQPASELIPEVARAIDYSEARVGTLYDTQVSIFGRQVESAAAGNDPETAFLYAGPVDEKTRDFCLELVGKVFTRAEIDEMDNGQLSNVFLTGGGYGCRHSFMEVSSFSELQKNVGTDRRAPEVETQIEDLQAAD